MGDRPEQSSMLVNHQGKAFLVYYKSAIFHCYRANESIKYQEELEEYIDPRINNSRYYLPYQSTFM